MKRIGINVSIVLFSALVFMASCTKADPNEETNDMLNGKWEATSLKTEDNIERITGEITKNELVFQKDSIDGGLMSWNIVTSLIQLEGWNGRYSISNSGTRLSFADKLYIVEFDGDKLNLTALHTESPFDIEAVKK